MSAGFAILWVFATTAVAMLPVQWHYYPGRVLLCFAPAEIVWLGLDYGWGAVAFGIFAVASMYRRPIKYYWQKLRRTEEHPR